MVFANNLLAGAAAGLGGAGYTPAGAIWLDGSADYLSWTPSSAGDRQKFTFSCWVKRSAIDGAGHVLFGAGTTLSETGEFVIKYNNNSPVESLVAQTGTVVYSTTTAVYRDPTAWHHVVYSVDTTTQVSKIFVNGVVVVTTDTTPTLNANLAVTNNVVHEIGRFPRFGGQYFEGYLAEVILLDGTAVSDAADFGEYDTNNNWVPIDPTSVVTANKGTNGFWLDFADSADLGNDVSGNGNDWTPTSMSAANSTNDNPADNAASGKGNRAVLNPLFNGGGSVSSNRVFTNANRTMQVTSSVAGSTLLTIPFPDDKKVYIEFKIDAADFNGFGVSSGDKNVTSSPGFDGAEDYGLYDSSVITRIYHNSSQLGGSLTPRYDSAGDIGQICYDGATGKLWFGVNNTWFDSSGGTTGNPSSDSNPTYTLSTSVVWFPYIFGYSSGGTSTSTVYVDFDDHTYTVTGAVELSTENLSAPTVTDPSAYFNTVLYTGNGSTQAITGVGFQPDLVWLKCRDTAFNHQLMDAVRGVSGVIAANLTDAESTSETDSFDSDGFTLTHNPAIGRANVNTKTFVAWCLKAGGAGSSNTDGSITSTVSVAAHGGFSIGTFTGTGANATVGHGLSSAPEFVIFKNRSAATSWQSWHSGLTAGDYTIYLDSTQAQSDQTGFAWQSTPPSSSVITLGTQSGANGSSNSMVFYAFAKTPGLIGIGSYIGNGSTDGPYVVVDDGGSGFRPAWVIFKRIDSTSSWVIQDAVRNTYNPVSNYLISNGTDAEGTSGVDVDFTANGFKIRTISNSHNTSGGTYIYLAFAEHPFGGEDVAQARAR
jgi:hypothetical protein